MSRANLISICRLCLKDSGSYSNLFEEHTMDNFLLMEVVNDTCQLDVQLGDGLPQFLCCKCYTKISEFELFRRRAHEVNSLLLCMKDDTGNVDVQLRGRNFRSLCSEGYARFKNEQFQYPKDIEDDDSTMDCNDHLEITMSPEKIECEDVTNSSKGTFEELVSAKSSTAGPKALKRNAAASIKESKQSISSEDATICISKRPKRNVIPVKRSAAYGAVGNAGKSSRKKETLSVCRNPGEVSKRESVKLADAKLSKRRTVRKSVKQPVIEPEPEERITCRRPRRAKVNALNREAARKAADDEESAVCKVKEKTGPGGGKLFLCDVCGKGSSLLSNLKIHMRIHTGIKPFQCDVCQKSFTQKNVLKWHKLTHTGERPYVCDSCGKRFSHPSSLSKHRLIHTGEKKHRCHLCEKAFAGKQELKIHVETHSRKPMYTCDVCREYFGFERDLIRHLLTHEIGELSNDVASNQASESIHTQLNDNTVRRDASSSCMPNSAHSLPTSTLNSSCKSLPESCLPSGTISVAPNPTEIGDSGLIPSDSRLENPHYDLSKGTMSGRLIHTQLNEDSVHQDASPSCTPNSVHSIRSSLDPSCKPLPESCLPSGNINVAPNHTEIGVSGLIPSDSRLKNPHFELSKGTQPYKSIQIQQGALPSVESAKKSLHTQSLAPVTIDNCQNVPERQKTFKCDVCDMAFVLNSDLQTHRFGHTGENLHERYVLEQAFSATSLENSQGVAKPYRAEVLAHKVAEIAQDRGVSSKPDVLQEGIALGSNQKAREVAQEESKPYMSDVLEYLSLGSSHPVGGVNHSQKSGVLEHHVSLNHGHKSGDIVHAKLYIPSIMEPIAIGSSQTSGMISQEPPKSSNKSSDLLIHPISLDPTPKASEIIFGGPKPYTSDVLEYLSLGSSQTPGMISQQRTVLNKTEMMAQMDSGHKPGSLIHEELKPFISGILDQTHSMGSVSGGGVMANQSGLQVCKQPILESSSISIDHNHKPGEIMYAMDKPYIPNAVGTLSLGSTGEISGLGDAAQFVPPQTGEISKSNLRKTKNSEIVSKPYKCEVCQKSFSFNWVFKAHQRHHSGETPFKCNTCDRAFSEKFILHAHMALHKPFKCDQCYRSFSAKTSLLQHKRTHHGKAAEADKVTPKVRKKPADKIHKCEICSKGFVSEKRLGIHKKQHSEVKPYECHICGKMYAEYTSFKVHRMTHIEDKPFKCDLCDKTFSFITLLKNHRRSHTREKKGTREKKPPAEKKVPAEKKECHLCQKVFKRNENLQAHLRAHQGVLKYKCDQCDLAFHDRNRLATHKFHHTKDLGNCGHKCEVCGLTFRIKSLLNSHKLTHSSEKPFRCEFCDKSYKQAASLTVHRRLHTGIRPYKCPFCEMTFCDHSSWKSHKATHTKDKIYQCDICHKAFSRMDSVTTHKKTHSGIRPHKCDFCEKSFPSSSSLKKHRMIHTGEKPHKCTFCDMRFSRADNLRTHMKVHSK